MSKNVLVKEAMAETAVQIVTLQCCKQQTKMRP